MEDFKIKVETQIRLDVFKPRPYQVPILDAIENKGYRKVLAILPRRAGKDMVSFQLCIRQCLRKVCVVFYIFPTFTQARRVIWDSITNDGKRILDYIPDELVHSKNSSELKIKFLNGSILQLVGSNDYDRLMGTNPQGVVFSEYALQDPRAYQFIRPILTANDGWAVFISTPRGKNHLWTLWNVASHSEDWFAYKMSVLDTGHISLEDIDQDRRDGEMSEDLIQQEYYCFPEGQAVLTDRGCVDIKNIEQNDMVVSHNGRLRKVLKTMSREYKGELIKIHSYGSYDPIACTPNHPLRIYDSINQTYSWKEAQYITAEDRLVFPKMTLGKIAIIDYEMCMLLAWFITEGSCFKNGVQWTVKKEEACIIKEYLDALNIQSKVHDSITATNVVVNSVKLVDFFKSSCGLQANNKRIPFHLISSYEEKFFNELIKGDGCYNISKNYEIYCFTTVSKTLAYQIQLLANSLNLGYAAGITMRESRKGIIEGREVNCQESYQVNISFPGLRSSGKLIRAKNSVSAKVMNTEVIEFDGVVYNFSVQYDESYLIGGRAVHNCSFDLGVEGAYYSKYLDSMRLKNQISMVPWESAFKVHTSWDLGVRDATSIIWFQCIGQTVRIIDCYENSKQGLEHYVQVIESKPYSYGKHFAPHDIRVQEWGTGTTRIEKAKQLGISFTIAPEVSLMDGIEAVRSAFSKIWIDEHNCKDLIKALENYRQEYDAKKKVYKSQPLHNWASHYADSFRYLCLSLPRTKDGMSTEELDNRYRSVVYGNKMSGFFAD